MKKKSEFTAFIFARGGSKGVKNKNIYPVAGKPLIAHSIISALESKSVARVIVSTDDEKIANTASEYGAEVLKRPTHIAEDTTPEILAWRHALDSYPEVFAEENPQPFISLPATSPLRSPEDIDAAIAKFRTTECDIIFGITPSHRNPYLNMVVIDENDLLKIAMSGSTAVRRQDVPDMYDVTTCVYIANANYVKNCGKLIDGRVGYVIIPPERALDIDNYYDLYLAELMLTTPYTKKQ